MSFLGYRSSPEVYGRHCNNFHPESLINILRIYVFKFVMFNYVISDIPWFAGSLRNKTNDLILNLTPENMTQHSRMVTTTRKGSSAPTKMSKIIGRQIH